MQLSEKAYQYIRVRLANGDLQPGHRLVTRTLASEIGVSLGPVREAILRLSSEGLVKHTPGAGAVVHRPSRKELEELYVLRDATESCAAGLAAKHASPSTIDRLESFVDIWQEIAEQISNSPKKHATKKQFERWIDTEEEFHELLIDACNNELLARVIREHRAVGVVFDLQRLNTKILTEEAAQWVARTRRELIAALRAGDSQLARELMSQQIQRGQQHVMGYFDRIS